MPKEHKKRGRRGEKRKQEDAELLQQNEDSGKRQKSADDAFEQQDYMPMDVQEDHPMEDAPDSYDMPFFGMLDESEQEYFKSVDDMLESNSFDSPDDRQQLLDKVYEEAKDKELKIALSQSCSRLMERLIQLSTPKQLKHLFQKFNGNFKHIFSHRFGSHCCEALFMRASLVVTQEMKEKVPFTADPDEVYVTMETLFLHTLVEIEGDIGWLMSDHYASHVIRTLLLVLAGEPFDSTLVQSKRKETVTIQNSNKSHLEGMNTSRSVPKSFTAALEKLIGQSVAGLDTDKLRAFAIHPLASPTLQLLLKLELTHFGKQRAKDETSIIRTLLPDDPITSECDSAKFITGIVYEPTGSHLVEKIVEHAPGKTFKSLYKEFFRERMTLLARNEIACYVVCRILERLGKDDLAEASKEMAPRIPDLLEKNRTVVIRTLIQRCRVRDTDTKVIAEQIGNAYGGANDFDIKTFLKADQKAESINEDRNDSTQNSFTEQTPSEMHRPREPVKVHFNLLAQSMLETKGPLGKLLLDSLIGLTSDELRAMAKDPIVSRTLQAALTSSSTPQIERRKITQHFFGSMGDLAAHKFASHVVDAIWEAMHDLTHMRERVAEELAENEKKLRESSYGRAVWRNWDMDLFKRHGSAWTRQNKAQGTDGGFQNFSEVDKLKNETPVKKTPLQLAREKHAKKKAAERSGAGKEKNFGSGANSRPVASV
ncbi:PLP-dependent transferase [Acrodontium crateriforme]|uniref:Nucleolar protein 9 n=1 Tax=Acrodontium crateriforme TaxID=150365 RepID=A0AAQ3R731_9PEZI|nr:PLP-dependent transferase [Acrodontium crateriforme]